MVKHSWGAGADSQVALLTESWWWQKRAGGGTLVMVDEVAALWQPHTDGRRFPCPRRTLVPLSDFGSHWGDCLALRRTRGGALDRR